VEQTTNNPLDVAAAPAPDVVEPVPVATQPAAKPVAEAASPYAQPGTMLVIPRVVLNYVVIAIVFFALGALLSGAAVSQMFNANSAENRQIVNNVIQGLMAQGGAGTAQGPQPGNFYEVSADDDPWRGTENAPITIVEFADFRCSFCKRFNDETAELILANFAGQVRMVYRDYPILGDSSRVAALAAGCMNDQGRFWDFHTLAYGNQQNLTRDAFIGYAQQLQMNVAQFTQCLDTAQHEDEIEADALFAQNLGVSGTPAFFINGRFVSGAQPYDVFAQFINEELARLQESTSADSTS
jgi:protein-disulfide isomerase